MNARSRPITKSILDGMILMAELSIDSIDKMGVDDISLKQMRSVECAIEWILDVSGRVKE